MQLSGSRESRGKIMSISNIEVMPIYGTAVSLDICDSKINLKKFRKAVGEVSIYIRL